MIHRDNDSPDSALKGVLGAAFPQLAPSILKLACQLLCQECTTVKLDVGAATVIRRIQSSIWNLSIARHLSVHFSQINEKHARSFFPIADILMPLQSGAVTWLEAELWSSRVDSFTRLFSRLCLCVFWISVGTTMSHSSASAWKTMKRPPAEMRGLGVTLPFAQLMAIKVHR